MRPLPMPDATLQPRVLAATAISYVVIILDTSIVNVALETIAKAFTIGITGLQWVVNAYTLAFASLLLTGGALGDRLGARRIYFAGLATFTLASALCGAAASLPALTAARILQGVGAAMLVPCSLSLINHAYPDPAQRAGVIGLWAGFGVAAMAAGPLAGGVLIHLLGWRGIFLVNLPIGLVGLWLTARIGTETPTAPGRHLDLAGQAAGIIALGLPVAALVQGPTLGWGSSFVLAGLFGSGVTWAAFLWLETRQAQPMLPLTLFRGRVFSASALVSMVSAFTFYGLVFVLSLYLQRIRDFAPLQAGLAFLPLTAAGMVGSLASGRLVRACGPRLGITGGFIVYAVGFLGLLTALSSDAIWPAALAMPLIGAAAGFVTPAATAAMMGTVEKGRSGIAAGVLNAARQTGAALGVAVLGTLVAGQEAFALGFQAALWVAAGMSLSTALIWWTALAGHKRLT